MGRGGVEEGVMRCHVYEGWRVVMRYHVYEGWRGDYEVPCVRGVEGWL